MKIQLLFFGKLSEVANNIDDFSLEDSTTTTALENLLNKKIPGLEKYTYRIAVNQEMVEEGIVLKENDVVAFMPPFAGG